MHVKRRREGSAVLGLHRFGVSEYAVAQVLNHQMGVFAHMIVDFPKEALHNSIANLPGFDFTGLRALNFRGGQGSSDRALGF